MLPTLSMEKPMSQVKTIETIPAENLHSISNIRQGQLPNIPQLSMMMQGPKGRVEEGQKTPLHVFRVSEYIDELEIAMPVLEEEVNLLSGEEQYARNSEFDEMQARLEALLEVPNPESSYVIVDGHRRQAAGAAAGYNHFQCMVLPAKASVSELALDQAVYGLSSEALDSVEEGALYNRLTGFGMTQKQICKAVGKSRAHIQQRLKMSRAVEAIEAVGSESALNYVDAVRAGEVKVEIANKVAQYNPEEVTENNLSWLLDAAMDDISGKDFVEQANQKLGRVNEAVNPAALAKGETVAPSDKDKSEPKTRTMRPEKDITNELEKWEMLSQLGKEQKVPADEMTKLEHIVEAFKFVKMGTPPEVPASLNEAADLYDDEIADNAAVEAEAKKSQNAVKNKGKKEERDAANKEKKETVDAWKLLYNNSVKPLERQITKSEKTIVKDTLMIEALADEDHAQWELKEGADPEKHKGFPEDAEKRITRLTSKIESTKTAIVLQKEQIVSTRLDVNLRKPDFFVASEIARHERAAVKGEKLLVALRDSAHVSWNADNVFPEDPDATIEATLLKIRSSADSLEIEMAIADAQLYKS